MTRRLFVLPTAQDDISTAAGWYTCERPRLGRLFLERLEELLQRIAEAPLQFPQASSGVRRGLTRQFPYAVYFAVFESRVDILAVVHLHRDPESWKRGR